jgi:sulfate permease, SulP family
MYTANVHTASRRMMQALDASGRPVRVLVVDATSVAFLSTTILAATRETERELSERGVEFWAAALPDLTLRLARRAPGWSTLVAEGRVWPTAADAVAAYRARDGH